MPLPIDEQLTQELKQLRLKHRFRTLRIAEGTFTDLSSNDYLSLSISGRLGKAVRERMLESEGKAFGATGSRLISGNSEHFERIEQMLARFHRTEAALIFNSGYDANLGLLSSIAKRSDTILYDEYCHASIRDGIQLSRCRSYAFRHNDIEDLLKKSTHARGKIFIVVESLYSMDGDLAPLRELTETATALNAALIVDEAHTTGVYGPSGEGYVQHLGLEQKVWARVHTFGKALGTHGAAVVGSSPMRDYLINNARAFIYTTAMPVLQLLSIEESYRLLPMLRSERDVLQTLREVFHTLAKESHLKISQQPTQIQYISYPGDSKVASLASTLRDNGFEVSPIRPPTVQPGTERIRICLHAHNTPEELEAFFSLLRDCSETNFPNGCSNIT